jgi:hypothetical protein
MTRILRVFVTLAALIGLVSSASAQARQLPPGLHMEGSVVVPDDMDFDINAPADYGIDEDGNSFLRKLDEIDATHPQPCGICDPITRATPDGTYTLPPQNR